MRVYNMIENIKKIFLVPMWYWILIIFMPNFFKEFPYEDRNVIKTWHGAVFLNSSFRSNQKTEFVYTGKYYKAYIKLRIEALKISVKYTHPELGVYYELGEKNGSC